jgi:hypothetical protein
MISGLVNKNGLLELHMGFAQFQPLSLPVSLINSYNLCK